MSFNSGVLSSNRHAIFGFIFLSGASGVTAGMLKVISVLFAIRLGANAVQIGIISGMESLCMALMTLPAGILVSRFGARNIYVAGSALITLVYTIAPLADSWLVLALATGLGGACMPLRMVALNGSFMERLKLFGDEKAGWYRAAGIVGTLLAGPSLATSLFVGIGVSAAYWVVAIFFSLMGVVGIFQLPDHAVGRLQTSIKNSISDMVRLTRHPVVTQICTIELSSGMVLAFFTSFIVLVGIQKLGLSEPTAVSVRFAEGIVSVCTMIFAGAFLTRQIPLRLYRASVLLTVLGLILLGVADNYFILVAAALLLGTGFGTTQLVNVQQLSRLDLEKGKVVSLQLLSSMGGAFLGSALGGFLTHGLGFSGMFFFGAALYALLSLRWCFRRMPKAITRS